MSDDFKKEEKTEHKKEGKFQNHKTENPSLVSATFIKYFFMTIITLVILFFLAFYMLPMFDRDGGQQQDNGDSGGILNIEINNTDDSGETESNDEAEDGEEVEEEN
ncbi:hypothetical protein RJD24_09395 [Bacillaceae bacterium IKA-2]|nr:hypothetical protein RJD24_09395 [Bacillaceae bacterium IKA-2]